jgi:hypothetical protein
MINFEQQADQARQHAAAMGISGTAIVDVRPDQGFLRLKVKLNQPDKLPEFMRSYAQVMVMMLRFMNVDAKIHLEEDAK